MPTMAVLTCTRDRPVPLALCRTYMARQTLKPDRWLIVDDGEVSTDIPEAHMLFRTHIGAKPASTLAFNILYALPYITTDLLVFMEDDDWYRHTYLQNMVEELGSADIAGETPALYYRVQERMYTEMPSYGHASLGCTVLHRRLFPELAAACMDAIINNDVFIDLRLWQLAAKNPRRRSVLIPPVPRLCVGIKGLPGQPGITSGWAPNIGGYTPDPDLTALRGLIGDDCEAYAQYYKPQPVRIPLI